MVTFNTVDYTWS